MDEKHKAIFKGIICENIWGVDRSSGRYFFNDIIKSEILLTINGCDYIRVSKTLRNEEIWSGEISRPLLKVGEEIYINDLDIIVQINKVYRTTNDEVMYETKHFIESLDTEKTKSTRLKLVEDWLNALYPNCSKFEELKSEFEKPEEKPEELKVAVEPWKPSWENEEKKEKTWFSWLRK